MQNLHYNTLYTCPSVSLNYAKTQLQHITCPSVINYTESPYNPLYTCPSVIPNYAKTQLQHIIHLSSSHTTHYTPVHQSASTMQNLNYNTLYTCPSVIPNYTESPLQHIIHLSISQPQLCKISITTHYTPVHQSSSTIQNLHYNTLHTCPSVIPNYTKSPLQHIIHLSISHPQLYKISTTTHYKPVHQSSSTIQNLHYNTLHTCPSVIPNYKKSPLQHIIHLSISQPQLYKISITTHYTPVHQSATTIQNLHYNTLYTCPSVSPTIQNLHYNTLYTCPSVSHNYTKSPLQHIIHLSISQPQLYKISITTHYTPVHQSATTIQNLHYNTLYTCPSVSPHYTKSPLQHIIHLSISQPPLYKISTTTHYTPVHQSAPTIQNLHYNTLYTCPSVSPHYTKSPLQHIIHLSISHPQLYKISTTTHYTPVHQSSPTIQNLHYNTLYTCPSAIPNYTKSPLQHIIHLSISHPQLYKISTTTHYTPVHQSSSTIQNLHHNTLYTCPSVILNYTKSPLQHIIHLSISHPQLYKISTTTHYTPVHQSSPTIQNLHYNTLYTCPSAIPNYTKSPLQHIIHLSISHPQLYKISTTTHYTPVHQSASTIQNLHYNTLYTCPSVIPNYTKSPLQHIIHLSISQPQLYKISTTTHYTPVHQSSPTTQNLHYNTLYTCPSVIPNYTKSPLQHIIHLSISHPQLYKISTTTHYTPVHQSSSTIQNLHYNTLYTCPSVSLNYTKSPLQHIIHLSISHPQLHKISTTTHYTPVHQSSPTMQNLHYNTLYTCPSVIPNYTKSPLQHIIHLSISHPQLYKISTTTHYTPVHQSSPTIQNLHYNTLYTCPSVIPNYTKSPLQHIIHLSISQPQLCKISTTTHYTPVHQSSSTMQNLHYNTLYTCPSVILNYAKSPLQHIIHLSISHPQLCKISTTTHYTPVHQSSPTMQNLHYNTLYTCPSVIPNYTKSPLQHIIHLSISHPQLYKISTTTHYTPVHQSSPTIQNLHYNTLYTCPSVIPNYAKSPLQHIIHLSISHPQLYKISTTTHYTPVHQSSPTIQNLHYKTLYTCPSVILNYTKSPPQHIIHLSISHPQLCKISTTTHYTPVHQSATTIQNLYYNTLYTCPSVIPNYTESPLQNIIHLSISHPQLYKISTTTHYTPVHQSASTIQNLHYNTLYTCPSVSPNYTKSPLQHIIHLSISQPQLYKISTTTHYTPVHQSSPTIQNLHYNTLYTCPSVILNYTKSPLQHIIHLSISHPQLYKISTTTHYTPVHQSAPTIQNLYYNTLYTCPSVIPNYTKSPPQHIIHLSISHLQLYKISTTTHYTPVHQSSPTIQNLHYNTLYTCPSVIPNYTKSPLQHIIHLSISHPQLYKISTTTHYTPVHQSSPTIQNLYYNTLYTCPSVSPNYAKSQLQHIIHLSISQPQLYKISTTTHYTPVHQSAPTMQNLHYNTLYTCPSVILNYTKSPLQLIIHLSISQPQLCKISITTHYTPVHQSSPTIQNLHYNTLHTCPSVIPNYTKSLLQHIIHLSISHPQQYKISTTTHYTPVHQSAPTMQNLHYNTLYTCPSVIPNYTKSLLQHIIHLSISQPQLCKISTTTHYTPVHQSASTIQNLHYNTLYTCPSVSPNYAKSPPQHIIHLSISHPQLYKISTTTHYTPVHQSSSTMQNLFHLLAKKLN